MVTRLTRQQGYGTLRSLDTGGLQFLLLISESRAGRRQCYLHTGSDDIHRVGEDGGSGCSQGPRDGLEDNVRALLRTQARQLLWNPGKDNASRYKVPSTYPHSVSTTKTSPQPSVISTLYPLHLCFYLHPSLGLFRSHCGHIIHLKRTGLEKGFKLFAGDSFHLVKNHFCCKNKSTYCMLP